MIQRRGGFISQEGPHAALPRLYYSGVMDVGGAASSSEPRHQPPLARVGVGMIGMVAYRPQPAGTAQ